MSDEKRKTVQEMVDEIRRPNGAPPPKKEGSAPKPAELDQDPGGGYNTNRTYPQS